jgi:hypothetical protein
MTRYPMLRPDDTLRLGGATHRVPMAPQPALEQLPAETVETALWWERHLIEVITEVPPGTRRYRHATGEQVAGGFGHRYLPASRVRP